MVHLGVLSEVTSVAALIVMVLVEVVFGACDIGVATLTHDLTSPERQDSLMALTITAVVEALAVAAAFVLRRRKQPRRSRAVVVSTHRHDPSADCVGLMRKSFWRENGIYLVRRPPCSGSERSEASVAARGGRLSGKTGTRHRSDI